MTLALDTSGSASSNFVVGEIHSLSDIYNSQYASIYPRAGPLYQKDLIVNHINAVGVSRTLTLGLDYNLIYPLPGITGLLENNVYGAIWLISERMTGQLSISYGALGGSWTFDTAQINTYQLTNYYNPNTYFTALVPSPEVYPETSAVSIETFAKMQASFALVGTIRLGVTYKPLSSIVTPPTDNAELARLLGLIANNNNSSTPGQPSNAMPNEGIVVLSIEPTTSVPPTSRYTVQMPDPNRIGGYFVRIFKTTHGVLFPRSVTVMKGDKFVTAEIHIDANGTVFIYGNVSLDSMTVRIH